MKTFYWRKIAQLIPLIFGIWYHFKTSSGDSLNGIDINIIKTPPVSASV